jgi:hypothetical protein
VVQGDLRTVQQSRQCKSSTLMLCDNSTTWPGHGLSRPGETGVRRTIFLFGIQHLRTRVALMPVASPTARCAASITALVLPIGLREAVMRIGTLGLREVCERGESD